jgi:anti-anti-sigma factor
VERQHRTWDLETVSERVPGGIVVTPKGRISSVTAAKFEEVVTAARADTAFLVMDLTAVDYISGAGVAAIERSTGNGGRVIICGLREPVRITLELARVLPDVIVKDTRETAIASLASNPEPRAANHD